MLKFLVVFSLIIFAISSTAMARPSQLPVPRVAPEWNVSE